jgi:hypothetical protein
MTKGTLFRLYFPRITAVLGNRIVYRDGVPVAAVESGQTRILASVDPAERSILDRLLDERPFSK